MLNYQRVNQNPAAVFVPTRSNFPPGSPWFFLGTEASLGRSQEPLDTMDKGYQPALDESMVKEFDPEDVGSIEFTDGRIWR